MSETMITIDAVRCAARRLVGIVAATPVLRSEALDRIAGAALLIKAEPLQHTGSFKFRGASNAIAVKRPPAVVAFSSGNHAQGVALAARRAGIPATIVMPADAPKVKLKSTRALGAEVIAYDRYREERERIGAEIAERTGAVLIPPYDDPDVIAGQGTVGLELAVTAQAASLTLDAALICCGGGGLIAGCATALVDAFPEIRIEAVEPEGFDDTARSLTAGQPVDNIEGSSSACDALLARRPGALTFPINRRLLRGGVSVSDGEAFEAMRLAFRHLRLVVEPGGAVALAAALFRKRDLAGRTVGVVVSGGNVDPDLFADVLRGR